MKNKPDEIQGDLIDYFGDNAWGGLFHQEGVIHQEELALYDHRTQSKVLLENKS